MSLDVISGEFRGRGHKREYSHRINYCFWQSSSLLLLIICLCACRRRNRFVLSVWVLFIKCSCCAKRWSRKLVGSWTHFPNLWWQFHSSYREARTKLFCRKPYWGKKINHIVSLFYFCPYITSYERRKRDT